MLSVLSLPLWLKYKRRTVSIEDGRKTDFWEDAWCGLVSLREKFPELYEICEDQNKSVAELAARGWRLNFRRWLDERAQNQLKATKRSTFNLCVVWGKG
jgi:hypothetical protein